MTGKQGVTLTEVHDEVLEGLDRPADELGRIFVDAVIDPGITGALGILTGDRLVFPRALTNGIVATHRLREAEVVVGLLSCVGNDLAGSALMTTCRGAPATATSSRPSRSEPAMSGGTVPKVGSVSSRPMT